MKQERLPEPLPSADQRYHSSEDGSMSARQSTLREQGQGIGTLIDEETLPSQQYNNTSIAYHLNHKK